MERIFYVSDWLQLEHITRSEQDLPRKAHKSFQKLHPWNLSVSLRQVIEGDYRYSPGEAAETVRNKDLFLSFLIEVQYMNEIQSPQDIKTFCPNHYSHKKRPVYMHIL